MTLRNKDWGMCPRWEFLASSLLIQREERPHMKGPYAEVNCYEITLLRYDLSIKNHKLFSTVIASREGIKIFYEIFSDSVNIETDFLRRKQIVLLEVMQIRIYKERQNVKFFHYNRNRKMWRFSTF
jgi:hypothetical protein